MSSLSHQNVTQDWECRAIILTTKQHPAPETLILTAEFGCSEPMFEETIDQAGPKLVAPASLVLGDTYELPCPT